MTSYLAIGLNALEKLPEKEIYGNIYNRVADTKERDSEELEAYLRYLKTWTPMRLNELPHPPPFDHRPERPVAWSAWWETVGRGRGCS